MDFNTGIDQLTQIISKGLLDAPVREQRPEDVGLLDPTIEGYKRALDQMVTLGSASKENVTKLKDAITDAVTLSGPDAVANALRSAGPSLGLTPPGVDMVFSPLGEPTGRSITTTPAGGARSATVTPTTLPPRPEAPAPSGPQQEVIGPALAGPPVPQDRSRRSYTIPGPDLSTRPEVPQQALPEEWPEDRISKALEMLEQAKPQAPQARNAASIFGNLLSGWARGAARAEGRGVGAQIAEAASSGAIAMEEAARYDKEQQKQYNRELMQFEVQRLQIQNTMEAQAMARRDQRAHTEYQNRLNKWKEEDFKWNYIQPKSQFIDNNNIMVTHLAPNGETKIDFITLDQGLEDLKRFLEFAKVQKALGGMTEMEVMNSLGEMVDANKYPGYQGQLMLGATRIMMGSAAPNVYKDARAQAYKGLVSERILNIGGDPNDPKHRTAMQHDIDKNLLDKKTLDEVLLPGIYRNIMGVLLKEPDLLNTIISDVTGFHQILQRYQQGIMYR